MDKRKGRTIKSERTSTRLQHSLDYLFDYYYQAKKSEGRAENTLKTYVQNYNYFCEFWMSVRSFVTSGISTLK